MLSRARSSLLRNRSVSLQVARALQSVKLFDIGEGIKEVEILKWFVREGDAVRAYDKLCEVQSDKATVEITSRFAGVAVRLRHTEGSIVQVGDVLCDIETPSSTSGTVIPAELVDGFADLDLGGGGASSVPPSSSSSSSSSPSSTSSSSSAVDMKDYLEWEQEQQLMPYSDAPLAPSPPAPRRSLATPAVRAMAKARGVDIDTVDGTGPAGRVTEADVEAAAPYTSPTSSSAAATAAAATVWRPRDVEAAVPAAPGTPHLPPSQRRRAATAAAVNAAATANATTAPPQPTISPPPSQPPASQTVPVRGVQRAMAKRMTAALQVPHLTYCDDVECNALLRLRAALNTDAAGAGPRVSFLPIVVKALSLALAQHPALNATVEDAECSAVVRHGAHHIGIAMDTSRGLVVPVVKDVQAKSVLEVAADLVTLQAGAAAGTLTEEQLSGGTFTVSNVGSIGGTTVAPVVLVPQVAILALGTMRVLPRYAEEDAAALMKQLARGAVAPTNPALPAPRPVAVMSLCLSADHRVVDGATVARFTNALKALLEDPLTLVGRLR